MTTKKIKRSLNEQIPCYLYRLMLMAFMGAFAFITFMGNFYATSAMLGAILLAFAVVKVSKKYETYFDSSSDARLLIVLSLICFVFKFAWIYFKRIEPQVDYETFYDVAAALSESWKTPNRYVALFPHILGYSTFLSIFMKIFGQSVFLATMLNVVLSVISGVFIYKIVKNLISTTSAVLAFSLWTICPSQTIYNCLVLSDPLYTTFILGFVYLVIVISQKEEALNWKKMLFYGALAAVILQCINVSRPIAMVLVIAMLIWIFVLRFKELFHKAFFCKWLSFFAALFVVYFSLGSLWNVHFTSRIGEAAASVPGYNIYVGFNEQSKGSWNQEDSALLSYYNDQEGATADWAQKQMLGEAKTRITSGNIDFVRLFMSKLYVFLGDDTACVEYCKTIIPEVGYMNSICNIFYYFTVLLSILGACKMLKTSNKSPVYILPLYVIGIICAQMLVEVAGRYHYSVIPFLIIISQFYLFRKRKEGIMPEGEKK